MRDHDGVHEIESLAELDAALASDPDSLAGWRLQSLDLSEYEHRLAGLDARGLVLLGCTMSAGFETHMRRSGAMVFPVIRGLPIDPYRGHLYTADELFDGVREHGYEQTVDARAYEWSQHVTADVGHHLGRALHDHAIDDALAEHLEGLTCVGVMGGHALARGTEGYREATLLGRSLARAGWHVATGGGPGAMEAANLGAYLSPFDDDALDEVLTRLGQVPGFQPSIGDWVLAALDVRSQHPHGGQSLGIPTWYYGHEPPNAFASHIAKYFQNSLREDTLLHSCPGGIVFLPGAGGTVQEIFQDACENYYADEPDVAPMVLVGREHWTERTPAWPLLQRLGEGRAMGRHLYLVDTVDEVLEVIGSR